MQYCIYSLASDYPEPKSKHGLEADSEAAERFGMEQKRLTFALSTAGCFGLAASRRSSRFS